MDISLILIVLSFIIIVLFLQWIWIYSLYKKSWWLRDIFSFLSFIPIIQNFVLLKWIKESYWLFPLTIIPILNLIFYNKVLKSYTDSISIRLMLTILLWCFPFLLYFFVVNIDIKKVKYNEITNLFKSILSDLLLVYKNFIHWNISKILITIFWFLLGILLSLPFFIILWLFIYFDSISWGQVLSDYISSGTISMSLMAEVYNNVWLLIWEWIILLWGVLFFIFWYSFKSITITQLYLTYLDGEKLWYFKNFYFNFKVIWSYLKLLFFVILILLIPVIIFIIAFFILLYSFWWVENVFQLLYKWDPNLFSILLLSVAFICSLTFIYLAYRLSFSYIILMDTKNYSEKSGISFYIKESFRITAGLKIFKFLYFMVLFSIAMIPINYLWTFIENRHEAIILLYGFLIFLTIWWLFEMYIVSIYKKVMLSYEKLWEKNSIINEKEIEEDTIKEEIL